jgi:hypothetical protein
MHCGRLSLIFLCLMMGWISAQSITQPVLATIAISNASSTGTTLNTLTKLTGAPSTAVKAATTDTLGVVGVTIAGAGTTGTAIIQINGLVNCIFSGATTAGHYVQISSVTGGDCVDSGAATYPTTGGEVIGRVLSTNGGAGTYQVNLFSADIQPPGSVSNCATGGAGVVQASNGSGSCEATSITDNGTDVIGTEPIEAPSFSTTGTGSGAYTSTGSTSGSAAIGCAAICGTPSKILFPTTDPGAAHYLLESGMPSGGSMQADWTNAPTVSAANMTSFPVTQVPIATASNTLTAQTTTQTLLTLTIPATGQYLLQVSQFPTALTGTLAITVAWTSYTGFSNNGFQLTSQNSSLFPQSDAFPLVAQAATTLTVTITVTGTCTYNASAVLTRVL